APVIVDLGSQTGLVVPLVAAHMFVFYFGLMADVTPPVGLASFAAAAVAKADFLKTGATAFFYSIRTGILPFIFIFNTDLLLIDIHSWWHLLLVVTSAILAMLVFAAATQGWFVRRNRWHESALLLLVTFTLLRPGFWLDQVYERYQVEPAARLFELAKNAPPDTRMRVRIEGTSLEGKDVRKTVLLPLGNEGDARKRIAASGLMVSNLGGDIEVMAVGLKSRAEKAGFEQGFKITGIETEADRPAKEWLYIPALLLLLGIYLLQRGRRDGAASAPRTASA
ncbi:MAG TPA: DUF3394 domain-containing protein, partial [Noviherbaspirillum sp.]|nr:DUF3394 domain-containing protein [Noviherbaspirillum sp.]